jgi:NAD(P)-dependent dehydrogenase (short-subunit alcohol dehydrogenase family)
MFTSVIGRSVVVTGASRGIGLGIAKVFAEAGANVLICARDEQALRVASDSLGEHQGQIATAMVDVADPQSCQDMAAYALNLDPPMGRGERSGSVWTGRRVCGCGCSSGLAARSFHVGRCAGCGRVVRSLVRAVVRMPGRTGRPRRFPMARPRAGAG